MPERISVGVLIRYHVNGTRTPLGIIWTDGRKLLINQASRGQRLSSTRAGGIGERFACRIGRWSFYLVEDNSNWFVEVTN